MKNLRHALLFIIVSGGLFFFIAGLVALLSGGSIALPGLGIIVSGGLLMLAGIFIMAGVVLVSTLINLRHQPYR